MKVSAAESQLPLQEMQERHSFELKNLNTVCECSVEFSRLMQFHASSAIS